LDGGSSASLRPRFEDLVAASEAFPVAFPTPENRLSRVALRLVHRGAYPGEAEARRAVEEQAAGTRVVVHEAVWGLMGEFLDHKRAYGYT